MYDKYLLIDHFGHYLYSSKKMVNHHLDKVAYSEKNPPRVYSYGGKDFGIYRVPLDAIHFRMP